MNLEDQIAEVAGQQIAIEKSKGNKIGAQAIRDKAVQILSSSKIEYPEARVDTATEFAELEMETRNPGIGNVNRIRI